MLCNLPLQGVALHRRLRNFDVFDLVLSHASPRPQEHMAHDFFDPVRSVFGVGTLASLPALVDGRKAALVTFPEARALGLVQRIEQLLGPSLVRAIDDVRPNPGVRTLRALYESFWRAPVQADLPIAVGAPETEAERMVAHPLTGARGRNFIGAGTAPQAVAIAVCPITFPESPS